MHAEPALSIRENPLIFSANEPDYEYYPANAALRRFYEPDHQNRELPADWNASVPLPSEKVHAIITATGTRMPGRYREVPEYNH